MASGVAVKTKRKGKGPDPGAKYSELAVRQNASILEYCRTSMSALSGCAAGILGLTGLHGFAFYFLTAFVLSVMLMLKAGSGWNKYFVNRRQLFIDGLFGGLFTYILAWTNMAIVITIVVLYLLDSNSRFNRFLYGMVHVY